MINMSIELIGLDNIPLVEPNDDICQIIKDAIDKLRVLLSMNKEVCNERKPEIIFLNDRNGNSYFKSDLSVIDKGFRNGVTLLLDRVKNEGNRRVVFDSNIKNGDIFFVFKAHIAISYCKLDEDTFLVIGIHTLNNGFDQEVNRFLANKDYIEELKILIKDDKYRETLVNEGKLVIEESAIRKLKR